MGRWMRKLFVILVTVATFGIVTPSQAYFDHHDENKQPKRDVQEESPANSVEVHSPEIIGERSIELVGDSSMEQEAISPQEAFVISVMEKAEEQSFQKFGTKIKPVIESEFRDVILPKMELTIEDVVAQLPEEDLSHLQVTELPTGGNGEMIFNIKNVETNEDVILFHVRKDHPPQEGYWFNFHYHTNEDEFQTHHELGSIYWDRNTPPKWLN